MLHFSINIIIIREETSVLHLVIPDMASTAPLKSLVIILSLIHQCVQDVPEINTVCLEKMSQYFYDNVQPHTAQNTDAQYALSIYVTPNHCKDKNTKIQNKFSKEDAAYVRMLLDRGDKCELCTKPKNVIASRPNINGSKVEHAEHVLLYPVKKSPMDKLLKQAKFQNCVVFYSFNSPCVKTCLKSDDNILAGLQNWKNKREEQMNAFVFQEIWQKDSDKDLKEEFRKIDAIVPLYRCARTKGAMNCRRCVANNVVDSYCLPKKNLVYAAFQEMIAWTSIMWSYISDTNLVQFAIA